MANKITITPIKYVIEWQSRQPVNDPGPMRDKWQPVDPITLKNAGLEDPSLTLEEIISRMESYWKTKRFHWKITKQSTVTEAIAVLKQGDPGGIQIIERGEGRL